MREFDVCILGAGAAGLYCALHAARRGLRTAVIDHGLQTGRKLRVTGGGRCNFGNASVEPGHFLSGNPHFVRSALARFGQSGFLDFLTENGLGHYQEPGGKLFCTQGAAAVADLLEGLGRAAGAQFFLGQEATGLEQGDGWRLTLSNGLALRSPRLVLACGGPAWPQVGATGLAESLAGRLGLGFVPFRPVLAPLNMGRGWPFSALSGVSLPVTIRAGEHAFTEDLLFTHQGLSGPAALQASCRWVPGRPVRIDLLPGRDPAEALREQASGQTVVRTALSRLVPARLAELLLPPELAERPVSQLRKQEWARLCALVSDWTLTPSGTAGFAKAEAAAGGVDTAQISSKTMEARKQPGLYVVGEALDVAGQLGGYNLHWAFASALAVVQSLP